MSIVLAPDVVSAGSTAKQRLRRSSRHPPFNGPLVHAGSRQLVESGNDDPPPFHASPIPFFLQTDHILIGPRKRVSGTEISDQVDRDLQGFLLVGKVRGKPIFRFARRATFGGFTSCAT